MLRKIIILIAVISQLFISALAYSDDILNNMEFRKYGTTYSNEDLGSRLRRLETDFFGMAQSGDAETRMNNLQQISGGNSVSAYLPPDDNFYPGKKQSAIKRFFNNMTSSIYDPGVITGYTPPIYNNGYVNSIYGNEYKNFLNRNNNYCPFNSRNYSPSYRQYHNHYYNNYNPAGNNIYRPYRNNVSSILPSMNTNNIVQMNRPYRPYRYNPYYNPYSRPTNQFTNVATRSSVHILQD